MEIGPGIGRLTRELASRARMVTAVEIDSSLIPVLQQTLADFDTVQVVNRDFMKLDLAAFVKEQFGDHPVCVCANLPYYITTPILMRLLESGVVFSKITVMVQKEVADRLCAKAGSSEYGAVTAAVAYYGKVQRLFRVSAGSFLPAPKVDSAVIQITPYSIPPVCVDSRERLFRIVRAAFAQRRKTLLNALCAAFDEFDREGLSEIISACGFDPRTRGETLSIADFAALEREIAKRK